MALICPIGNCILEVRILKPQLATMKHIHNIANEDAQKHPKANNKYLANPQLLRRHSLQQMPTIIEIQDSAKQENMRLINNQGTQKTHKNAMPISGKAQKRRAPINTRSFSTPSLSVLDFVVSQLIVLLRAIMPSLAFPK